MFYVMGAAVEGKAFLRVNLIRRNVGEHEIPRFSLIRPQWRFPDKPVRSFFLFLPAARAAVFFTTTELQRGELGFSLGSGNASPPDWPEIASRCTCPATWGEETPFQSSMPRLSHRVGNRRVWRLASQDADETKLGQKPPRREGRFEIVHFSRRRGRRRSCPYSFYRS